jgi:hypothetical protein
MKTTMLEIEHPEDMVPVFENNKLIFKEKPKNIRDRINGWADVLEYHNMTADQFDVWCTGLRPHEVATRQEELIAEAYNLGVKPDFTDGTEKRVLYFVMGSPSGVGFRFDGAGYWYSPSFVGSRLVFVGEEAYENACDASAKFIDIYKISRTQ